MKFTQFGLSFACAGALAFAQIASAQDYGGQDQTQSSQAPSASQGQMTLSSHDQKFLKSAAENNLAATQAAQIAQQKSTNPQVKQFAQQQLQMRQSSMNQLNTIARQNNMSLPTQLSSTDQKAINRLQSASGPSFDQEYTRWVSQNDQKALNSYQKEAQSGQNPMLKSYASSSVSALQSDVQRAQNLQRGASAAAGQSTGQSQPMGQTGGQPGQQGY